MINADLIHKYNVAGPRYTSYPTVPYWSEADFSLDGFLATMARVGLECANTAQAGISLYIHLPFCESLCTFCACHHRITKKHSVEAGYIDALLAEWALYVAQLRAQHQPILVREIHLGGGTPTFFAPENLQRLIEGLFTPIEVQRAEVFEFSFEGHPNNTTPEHLQTLYDLGFRRVSFGVQDYDARVQTAINRIQPIEHVARVTEAARAIGYTSISHDLVYGLPHQTEASMRRTIEHTVALAPDRLAFYSYAHVPWLKGNGQRGFDEADLPSAPQKRALYELGKTLVDELGYLEIGMDHSARPADSLTRALLEQRLHRNFMGYTETNTRLMVGLGASSISDSWYGFAQNEKHVETYVERVLAGQFAITRGHILTPEDALIRQHILNLMCQMRTSWGDAATALAAPAALPHIRATLAPMQDDGLLVLSDNAIEVTELGRPFVRNIAMAFDARLWASRPETRIFSMTI